MWYLWQGVLRAWQSDPLKRCKFWKYFILMLSVINPAAVVPRGTNPGEFDERHWEKELKVVRNIVRCIPNWINVNPF